MTNLEVDHLRINKLVLKIDPWVASAMLRRVELCDDNLVIPHALAARAAVLAFGDELIDLELPDKADSQRLAGRSRNGGCPPDAARRGRAAPGAAAAGQRRQEIAKARAHPGAARARYDAEGLLAIRIEE
jgi:hypothetical protein